MKGAPRVKKKNKEKKATQRRRSVLVSAAYLSLRVCMYVCMYSMGTNKSKREFFSFSFFPSSDNVQHTPRDGIFTPGFAPASFQLRPHDGRHEEVRIRRQRLDARGIVRLMNALKSRREHFASLGIRLGLQHNFVTSLRQTVVQHAASTADGCEGKGGHRT